MNGVFSNVNKNYAVNLKNFRSKPDNDGPNKTDTNIYQTRTEDENLSYRSYTHLSNHKQTKSDGKYNFEQAYDSRPSDQEDGILKLRKQMLNQEYQHLEKQRVDMNIGSYSPISLSSRQPSEFATPYDLAEERLDML